MTAARSRTSAFASRLPTVQPRIFDMKTILKLAAVAAALATASIASAQDTAGGHWEWQAKPPHGPKSTFPSHVRVWIKDADNTMASCNCAMMKVDRAACMMNMPGKAEKPSVG